MSAGRIAENWTDEARAAAIEARRRKRRGLFGNETAAERHAQGIVHVTSDVFGGPHVADFQNFNAKGTHANVHLHLPEDHLAVLDAKGDNPDMHPDHFEFIDLVPVAKIESFDKDYRALGKSHAAELRGRREQDRRDEAVLSNIARRSSTTQTPRSRADAEARKRELRASLRTTSR